MDAGDDPRLRQPVSERIVVAARVLGVPVPGLVVWRSVDDPDVAGDLDDAPDGIRTGDLLVLGIQRDGFRWQVVELVDHQPVGRRPRTRRRRPHAHPARPPGTVLVAWLPFTREEDDAPGKHRPCVVLHSTDPEVIRARPLFDPGSAHVRRHGGVQLRAWRASGLDKASVAGEPVEIPVRDCAQTLGDLAPVDRVRLGIEGPTRHRP